MVAPERRFEAYDPATGPLKEMPLLVGITGPSGSGKSYSAGELATGMLTVYGGRIYWIDTENDRALELHKRYGGPFDFHHVPFPQPKSPAEYDTIFRYCLDQPDCGVIIIDNLTHEHVALLDMMEDYMERKGAGDDWQKRDRLLFASMVIPKAQRKRLNERIAFGSIRKDGQKVPVILLYRAQDKTKPGKSKQDGGDGKPIHKGWQAETSSDLPFYMTARFLLPPGSDGHPNTNPDTEWERLAIKNPQQFRDWFKPGFQLNREIGARLARWAKGGRQAAQGSAPGADRQPRGQPERAAGAPDESQAVLEQVAELLGRHCKTKEQRQGALEAAFGGFTKAFLTALPVDQLAVGLAALRQQLEGLAALRDAGPPEREPGMEG